MYITLYRREDACRCADPAACGHQLAPLLQVLTSDLDAPAPDLLFTLRAGG